MSDHRVYYEFKQTRVTSILPSNINLTKTATTKTSLKNGPLTIHHRPNGRFPPTDSQLSSIKAKNSNLVLSPASLHIVLSLIASGWTGSSGSTRDQTIKFLKSKSSDDLNKLSSELVSVVFAVGSAIGGPKLSFANGVWVDQTLPLKPTFKQVVDNVYKATSNQVDFLHKVSLLFLIYNSWVFFYFSIDLIL